MRSFRPTAIYAATAIALLAVAACNKPDSTGQDALAQDSSLTRDLQLANNDTTAQPQLKDVPTTPPPAPPKAAAVEQRRVASAPPPRRRTPTPTPRQSEPVAQNPQPVTTTPSGNTVVASPSKGVSSEGAVGVVAAGTNISLSSGQRVCTNTNSVGDRITATLADGITASNGVMIPAGATAVLEVTSLGRSNQAGENMNIGFVVRSISYGGKTYPVNGEIVSADVEKVKAPDNNDATKVAGGAVVGAILGRILGGGRNKTKGTIIGAAGGAAAGAVLAHQTEKYDACLPSGGKVVVRLDSPMSVQAGTASNGVI
ncbi:MAG: glycine zipper 2TM domain-containing protein [Gemmatimonadaceae bacterium]